MYKYVRDTLTMINSTGKVKQRKGGKYCWGQKVDGQRASDKEVHGPWRGCQADVKVQVSKQPLAQEDEGGVGR